MEIGRRKVERSEIAWHPTVDLEKCSGCGACFEFCPHGVYKFDGKPIVASPNSCVLGCSSCRNECPSGAISFPTLAWLRDEMKRLEGNPVNPVSDAPDRSP